MSVDFSNLEIVVGAYVIDDPVLIDIVESGINFHDAHTELFFDIKPDHPQWKTYRDVSKIIEFARLFYGGSDRGVYSQVMTDVPECGLTFNNFMKAINAYMKAHPAYIKWVERVQEIAKKERISVNAFGRVRTFLGANHGLGRAALNTPIQGTAADCVRQDMTLLNKYQLSSGLKARTVLQIHDEFVFHYPISERKEVAKMVKECMGREREINGHKFRIGLDAEVGKYWGNLQGFDLDTLKLKGGSKH